VVNPGFSPVVGRPRGTLVSPVGFDSVLTFAVKSSLDYE